MNERTVFITALEKEDSADRKEYLDKACAGDPALRERVEALLRSHEREGSFLDVPAPEQLAPGGASLDRIAAATDVGQALGLLAPSDKAGSLGRLGHYDVQEVIGTGGMRIVLKAFDDKLHRVVAIKVMAAQPATSATARMRFVREAQAAAAVSHDHVVTIFAVEAAALLPYLVMQYVAGLSLQQRLDRDGPLDRPEILRIGMQTASGLAAAHAQGLVHRDIKPANILLENSVERVRITDFGLARAAAEARLTQTGAVAGTPQYLSPEQAEGKAIDQRADLFSLGSVLYARNCGAWRVTPVT
jgi:serine/threonine protein kinase